MAFVGLFFYERNKRKTAEEVIKTIEDTKEVYEIGKTQSKVSGLIEAEEEKREGIKNEKAEKSLSDLADFFNTKK